MGIPFDAWREAHCEEVAGVSGVSYDLWVGLWQKSFCENPILAFKFLTYTGFTKTMADAVQPVRIGVKDVLNPGNLRQRHLFTCFVIGAGRSRKSALLDSIIAGSVNEAQILEALEIDYIDESEVAAQIYCGKEVRLPVLILAVG